MRYFSLVLATLSVACVEIDLKDTAGEGGEDGSDGIDVGEDTGGEDTGGEDTATPPGTAFTVLSVAGLRGVSLYDLVYSPSAGMYFFSSPIADSNKGAVWGVQPTNTDLGAADVTWSGNSSREYFGVNIALLGSTHLGSSIYTADGSGMFYAIPLDEVSGNLASLTTAGSITGDTPDGYFGTASVVSGGNLFVTQTNTEAYSVWSAPAAILTDGPSAGGFSPVADFAVEVGSDFANYVAMDLVASPTGILSISYGGYLQHVGIGSSDWYSKEGVVAAGIPSDADMFSGRTVLDIDRECWGTYLERTDEYAVTCTTGLGFETYLIDPATGAQNALLDGVSSVVDASIGGVQVRILATDSTLRILAADGSPIREDVLPFENCDTRLAGDGSGHIGLICRQNNEAAFGQITL
jgi:hypothetical protein